MARLDQTRAAVAALAGQWRGGTPVTVVASVTDLPIKAPADARGLYRRGETWIVADTQPIWQVAQTVVHEILGHHSMRQSLGSSWRPFMHAIQAGLRSGDQRLQLARSMVREAYVDDAGRFNLSPVGEADELTALVAELGFDAEQGCLMIQRPVRKIAAATAGQFARETLYMDRPATFEELEGALLTAEHRLRHGGPVWGLGQKVRGWYSRAMAKPWNPNKTPMSLRESEFLLREDADQTRAKEDYEGLWLVFQLIAAVLLFIVGCIGNVWNFASIFGLLN